MTLWYLGAEQGEGREALSAGKQSVQGAFSTD